MSTIKPTAATASPPANSYIVMFKDGTPNSEIEKAIADVESAGGKVEHRYDTVLLGFSAKLPDIAVMALESNEAVESVEKDSPVKIC